MFCLQLQMTRLNWMYLYLQVHALQCIDFLVNISHFISFSVLLMLLFF